MGDLRTRFEAAPDVPDTIEATDDSYDQGCECLAKFFLRALDAKGDGWEPPGDWASALGDLLYAEVREALPETLRDELTGMQVAMAAYAAYRAYLGD